MKTAISCSNSQVRHRDTGHSLADPSLPPLWFCAAAEKEIQSPSRATEEVLAAGEAEGSSVTKAQLLQFHFLPSKMRKYAPLFGTIGRWALARSWGRTKGGLYRRLYLWKLLQTKKKMFYYFNNDFFLGLCFYILNVFYLYRANSKHQFSTSVTKKRKERNNNQLC